VSLCLKFQAAEQSTSVSHAVSCVCSAPRLTEARIYVRTSGRPPASIIDLSLSDENTVFVDR